EDGIRDWSVTGVQTCALPISDGGQGVRRSLPGRGGGLGQARRPGGQAGRLPQEGAAVLGGQGGLSGFGSARAHGGLSEKEGVGGSEERRVGKEWGDRVSAGGI